MRSGILCYIYPHVERAFVFCVIFFCVCNALWCFVLFIFLLFSLFRVVFYVPCFHLFFIFRFFETILGLRALVLWIFVLYSSACVTRSGIVDFRVIYFLPVLSSCCMHLKKTKKTGKKNMICCIFLRVEHDLVLCVIFFCMCNVLWCFVPYFSVCGTALWYFVLYFFVCVMPSGIFCYTFS